MGGKLSRGLRVVIVAALAGAAITALAGSAAYAAPAPEEPELVPVPELIEHPRAATPEDRYAPAGGCYTIRALNSGGYVTRSDGGFAATAAAEAAEPFHFQATDLARYLLFGTAEDFLAADTTPLATGVIAAAEPSEAAELEIEEVGGDRFTIAHLATGRLLTATPSGELAFADPPAGDAAEFAFELTDGCADWPEVEINVNGAPAGGETFFAETRGFLDAHMHPMAFEFLGGNAHCARPWHRYGVTQALVDCPDHEGNGNGAVLENLLRNGTPTGSHDTVGWPTFVDWPAYNSLTHEGMYYRWLERAWRGGLRMMTALLVDNNVLCEIYPTKRNSCNEMDGVRLQAQRLREFQDYIDAQSGGPGEGWLRIVYDPFEARRVINQGKFAVMMGIEVSVPFDCGETLEVPLCTAAELDERLDEVYALGVRQMEITNKFDNALTGVKGDAGELGLVINGGNFLETGHYWKMVTCDPEEVAHDHTQLNPSDGGTGPLTGRDALAGGILQLFGPTGTTPLYPEGPHCNTIGLTALGEQAVRGLMERGMIFDPDHMGARARDQALDVVESEGYSGVISSHSWSDGPTIPRIYQLGGVVTPYAGSSSGFAAGWPADKQNADPRFYFGYGYGADMNGFGGQGPPRGAGVPNPVTYPFAGFGGVEIDRQRSGERVYDLNVDGVAHYGLYPDWIEDVRILGGDALITDMARGPESFLQMWERANGIAPNACSSGGIDRRDLLRLRLRRTTEWVLRAVGQPASRIDREYRYCVKRGSRMSGATVVFNDAGRIRRVLETSRAPGS